ncbi:MAG: MaoC family dehydratase [Alphaproteobacteria bacterium]
MLIPKSLSGDGRLYLEDLAVGQRFVTAAYKLSAEEIMAFGRQYDPQPFHLDAAAAKESLFEGLAASGWHTAAISMKLLVESGPKIAGGLIGAGGELSWPRPTRPGDTLHVETEVLAITPSKSRPDRGMITVRNTTLNQNGETVQGVVARLVVPRRM